MPYFIEQVPTGWNTVKDDGTILGQHKTKQQAIKQMVAVSISEGVAIGGERAVAAGSYSPPAGVAVAAKRALQWISEGFAGSGFTAVGRARAVQLASGADVSADTVNRMISYFARHEVDKQAEGFTNGEDGFPSAGRVAWDAWGGDAGQSWVNGLPDDTRNGLDLIVNNIKETEDRQMEDYSVTELKDKAYSLKGDALETIAKLAETVYELCEIVDSMGEPVVVEDVVEDGSEVVDLSSKVMEEDSVRFVDPSKVAELHERGERVISVLRLERLARFYGVTVDQLLPRDKQREDAAQPGTAAPKKLRIDVAKLSALEGDQFKMLERLLRMIQVQRQDFNGKVITVRANDTRAIAVMLDVSIDDVGTKLAELDLLFVPPNAT